jgi:hypothetical protein
MGDFQPNKTTLKERGSLPIFCLSAPDVEPEYGFGMLGIPPRVPPAAALIVVMEVVQFFKVLAWCLIQGFFYMHNLHESIATLPPSYARSLIEEPKLFFPDFQPMSVSEEPVCVYLFWQNLVFTSLHLRSHFHVVPPMDVIISVVFHIRGTRTCWIQN